MGVAVLPGRWLIHGSGTSETRQTLQCLFQHSDEDDDDDDDVNVNDDDDNLNDDDNDDDGGMPENQMGQFGTAHNHPLGSHKVPPHNFKLWLPDEEMMTMVMISMTMQWWWV